MPIVSEEQKYFDLLNEIKEKGNIRDDRTGTGTKSIFGAQTKYNIENNVIPLLTTKRTFWRGIIEEMLWMLRGSTSAKELDAKGVKIWNANTTREFLDSRGLNYPEGEIGPGYGFQWRHFNGTYNPNEEYTDGYPGFDQISEVMQQLRKDPFSRRILVSTWNPCQLDKMALPPCHLLYQFYVEQCNEICQEGKGKGLKYKTLQCQLYQRSGDMFLGVPFNIAFYSTLTHLMAYHLTQEGYPYKAKQFVHTLGDAHIYLDHMDAVNEQLSRSIESPFPTINIEPKEKRENIWDYKFEDFQLINYNPQKRIAAKMSV